ncbi:MAG: AtpZ/AtpI family protein [Chloroflexi bacterium]|jgi:F0F1-type ATP synthase assembly protein I|nr:AtpZ/AtpI family protein [Chloroflexota bacterium]
MGKARREQALRLALLGLIGQVGCLTLAIIVAALIAGLWLDSRFDTRPLFTLILVLGSIPVTLFLMLRLVLSAAPRLQIDAGPTSKAAPEEERDREERATD